MSGLLSEIFFKNNMCSNIIMGIPDIDEEIVDIWETIDRITS